jgi:predicted O-methyltransferase YrrM
MLTQHFKSTNVDKKIRQYFGHAAQIIVEIEENNFDLVFIDADKRNNFLYFQLIFDKVNSGGLIIIDNVLWKGKVYGNESDVDTRTIRELNDRIAEDTRVEKLILPIRDGIMLIRKK